MPRNPLLALLLFLAALIVGGCKPKDATSGDSPGTSAPAQGRAVAQQLTAAQAKARQRPDDVAAQMTLARLAYESGAFNDAYRAYRQSASIDSSNYEAMLGLARTNLKLQNPTEGLDWLLRAKRLKPQDPELKELEARLLLVNGNFDRAIECFQTATRANPDRITTWLNLASAYALMNRTAEAVATARQAVKISPDDPAPHFALGRHLQRARDNAGAEAEYRKALELDQNHAGTMVALARLLMEQNRRLDEARQLAIKASIIQTDRADAAVIAAWILHLQGDDRKAANELIKLVNASPQNPEAWQKLSVVLNRIGKPEEAKQAAEMAQRFIPGRRAAADLQLLDTQTSR